MLKNIKIAGVLFCFVISCNQVSTREGACCESSGEGGQRSAAEELRTVLNDAVWQSEQEARNQYLERWHRYNNWVEQVAGAVHSLLLQVDRSGDNEIDFLYLRTVLNEVESALERVPPLSEVEMAVDAGTDVLEAYRSFLRHLEQEARTGEAFFFHYQGVIDSFNRFVVQAADVRRRMIGSSEPVR